MVHCLLVLGIICVDIEAGIPILQALEKSQDVLICRSSCDSRLD